MNQQYYIGVNGQQTGPFSLDELKAKGIQRDTLIWTEGLEVWTKAEYVAPLKDILRSTPPPLPNSTNSRSEAPQQTPPPLILTPPKAPNEYFGYELATRLQRFLAFLVESVIFLAVAILLFLLSGGNESDLDEPLTFGSIVAGVILSAIFGAMFYTMWSGNLGHKIMGLKVISSVDGGDQQKAIAGALREGLKNLFSLVVIPAIWLLWDSGRQNLYDKVLKTYVVKKK